MGMRDLAHCELNPSPISCIDAADLVGMGGSLAHSGLNPSSISCTGVVNCVCCRSLEGVDLIGGIAYDGRWCIEDERSIAVVVEGQVNKGVARCCDKGKARSWGRSQGS